MKKSSGFLLILSLSFLLLLRFSLLAPTSPASPSPSSSDAYAGGDGGRGDGRLRRPLAHLLTSLPGLSDLFTPSPNSTGERRVWAHMRGLLARSDSLPSTAAGVREAAAAWRHLAAAAEDPTTRGSKESCPFSVSGNAGSSLRIPCGLAEDAAVTLIGVPIGKNGSGSFRIELIGSNLASDAEAAPPPVVLRCDVSLGKEGPVISQSAWSPELGWSEPEQCPAHVGSSSNKVDGLVRCNEQTNKGVAPENNNLENVNASRGESEKASKRGAHLSAGFPIVEGHPFTATLWAGAEGFHMTVNGRHEMSFAYQERLEPWSVTEVRVSGDLDLLSVLANGLPVSEDVGLTDVELLKAPPLLKKRIFLLVGVFSTGSNFKRRMALRRSWMQYEAVRLGNVAVRFFTGLHKNEQVNLELWKEAQLYGDIQLMPFVDYYSLITLKTIAICILGTKILPAKYIMKTDDDAFVRIDEVLSSLEKSDSSGLLYGLISFQSSPHRDKGSKWFISSEEWPIETYPPWAHGPGYIISRDIAKFIVRGHQERTLQLFKLEDVAMGIWIQEYKNDGRKVNYINDDRFHNEGCESDYVLAHYQSPRLVLCLWEKLQKEHKPECCE